MSPSGAAPAVPTGNTFDKYGSTNPVVRRLMGRFEADLGELFALAAPRSLLDVGCGEGVLSERWAADRAERRVVAVDLPDPKLAAEWALRRRANLEFRELDATAGLPFADGEFELATAIEVLEHVPAPERLLREMARVSSGHLLLSVPREPLWRALNVGRGAYLRSLGNTPGHVNHWSRRGFVSMLSRLGKVRQVRSPFPWTMVLVTVA